MAGNDVLIAGAGMLIGYLGTIFWIRNRNSESEFTLTYSGMISSSDPGSTSPNYGSEYELTLNPNLDLRAPNTVTGPISPLSAPLTGINFSRRRQFPSLFFGDTQSSSVNMPSPEVSDISIPLV